MISSTQQRVVGEPLDRIDGPKKVTGTATYAFEHTVDDVAYAFPVQSTIAKGQIVTIDFSAAQAIPGVVSVLTHENAPRLKVEQGELAILQSNQVAYRGQFVALVVAETIEVARQAAEAVVVRYEEQSHNVVLRADSSDLYKPDHVNPNYETDTSSGDVEAALAQSAFSIDCT
ncbi:MAG TPA: xanthine dehydrogenase family protein molybdopterin-binding subunit, partial [Ktedonobacteraceae bacterium]